MLIKQNRYNQLLETIGLKLANSRQRALKAINSELLLAKWEIGRDIIEYEQHGNEKAEYGSSLLNRLATDLKQRYGNGFSRRSVSDMRRFYLFYLIWQTLYAKLTWSHYVEK